MLSKMLACKNKSVKDAKIMWLYDENQNIYHL